ncbi:cellulose biosynthesis protein BcsR, partial [Enterobacter hormaechei]|uniref:cellulose biosynthesis protein BcsR n=1 Tax=Enterobacter hormaechei TaxID=158836 RepID=UPI0038FD1771
DRNRSHWSTSKTPSYTKSVSWQHHPLTQAFSLPEIDYTDISQREQLAAAIKRWPLLAEFAQQQ